MRADEDAARGLTLPRGEEREVVEFRRREYSLTGSETRALATVGAFRVVSPADFGEGGGARTVRPFCRIEAARRLIRYDRFGTRPGVS